jgi:hypothetical protein
MIRMVVGFLLVFGAVGGMDNGPQDALMYQVIAAAIGLMLMYFGSKGAQFTSK